MQLLLGDCSKRLKELPPDSIDALVTDPPAGIAFMGKEWDKDKGGRAGWVAWMTEIMRECHRVMKPGAHGLVWALPRTSHWTATALDDAGFEIRDVVTHLFGQGFPKSLDVSKAIDKANGDVRPVVGHLRCKQMGGGEYKKDGNPQVQHAITSAASAAWQGWGTALKPASEHWILIRRPISEKTVAANVLKWGTGALNIDASRIESAKDYGRSAANAKGTINAHGGFEGKSFKIAERDADYASPLGRFPANLVLSHSPYCDDDQCDIECAVAMLDAQSGISKSNLRPPTGRDDRGISGFTIRIRRNDTVERGHFDSGGASRFFYCAKISTSERNAGLENMEARDYSTSTGATRPNQPARPGADPDARTSVKNTHPTVKTQKLMRYLCRLVTPPGGVILDPFMGSGSTGLAAKSEGFDFIGIEQEAEYLKIAEGRINGINTDSHGHLVTA